MAKLYPTRDTDHVPDDGILAIAPAINWTKFITAELYPQIVEFAELDGFMDMKLRNFSSGMLMRLAFAIAVAPLTRRRRRPVLGRR